MSLPIKPYKKFFRSRRDKMIAGVCGGLANYFNIDPTILRLLFAGLFLIGGASVLVYVMMWIIVPLEK